MPSAIEPFPREADQRNEQQYCEDRGSLAGKPTHEEAEGGGSDGGQVGEDLECGSELGRQLGRLSRAGSACCRRRVHCVGHGLWVRCRFVKRVTGNPAEKQLSSAWSNERSHRDSNAACRGPRPIICTLPNRRIRAGSRSRRSKSVAVKISGPVRPPDRGPG